MDRRYSPISDMYGVPPDDPSTRRKSQVWRYVLLIVAETTTGLDSATIVGPVIQVEYRVDYRCQWSRSGNHLSRAESARHEASVRVLPLAFSHPPSLCSPRPLIGSCSACLHPLDT